MAAPMEQLPSNLYTPYRCGDTGQDVFPVSIIEAGDIYMLNIHGRRPHKEATPTMNIGTSVSFLRL